MKNNLFRSGIRLLLLTATIWGVAFVAQSVSMDYIGGFTFNAVRNIIGAIALAACHTGDFGKTRVLPVSSVPLTGKEPQNTDHRRYLLRYPALPGKQLPAVRYQIHHRRQSRIHHRLLHHHRSGHRYLP